MRSALLLVVITVLIVLIFPLSAAAQSRSLYMPAIQAVGASDSMLALSNLGSVSASVTIIARSYDGAIIKGARANPSTMSLPPLNSKTLRPKDLFGENLPPAWIEVQTTSNAIAGSFTFTDASLPSLEGSALIESGSNRIIFPKVTTDSSSNNIAFVNTNARKSVKLSVTLFSNTGQLVAQRSVTLAPDAGFSGRIGDLVPDLGSFDGYAIVEAAAGSDANTLAGIETWRGQTDMAALPAIPDSDRFGTGHVSHFASQSGYTSTLVLVNYGNNAQTLGVTAGALEYNGKAADTPSQTQQVTLGPNQRLEARLDELFDFSGSTMITGFVRFQTQDDAAAVYGYLELKTSGGRLTAVPVQGDGATYSSFSYITDGPGSYTALALLNPGMANSSVRIDAFDIRGYLLGTATVLLAPNGHWSRLLRDVLPQTESQNGGSIHIAASTIVLALELLGSTAGSGTLAVLPAQRSVLESQQGVTLVAARVGGAVTSKDGTSSLSIPAGSLMQDSLIRVSPLSVEDFPKPSDNSKLLGIVQGLPAGTRFQNPVRLRFPLTEPLPPGAVLDVMIFNPATQQYDESEFLATVDSTGQFAVADVTHFTVFAVANKTGVRIANINPSSGLVGSPVTISGSGFASAPSGNIVRFSAAGGQAVSANVLTATPDTLTTVVPSGAITGSVYVMVGPAKSNRVMFRVLAATDQPADPGSSPDTVTANNPAAANKAPTVNAGADQTITLPAMASLFGTVSDDGLPNGVLTSVWAKLSGPGTVTFGSAASPSTTAAFSVAGTYTIRLTASDSALPGIDDVVVVVNPSANKAPTVNAGTDQTITLPAMANLSGAVSDDGLPNGALTSVWAKLSGPGTVTFGSAASIATTAAFSVAGTYTIRLTASDSVLPGIDDVVVVVNPAPPTNKAPVVSAGQGQTITYPNSLSLSGAATDDGLPNGSTISVTWSKLSGPSSVIFVNVNALNATASFLAPGTYTLRLTATDGALTTTSDMVVVVNPAVIVNSCPSSTLVSGSWLLTAAATDDVGVAGVQFTVDGVNIGTEVTAAPYELAWDSRTVANGCHVLTAIARDAAGNQGVSSLNANVSNP